jgi:hypothetical protein
MARPQTPFTGKERKTGPNKMRMSHDRMRRDIKRIEEERAKIVAAEAPKPRRK